MLRQVSNTYLSISYHMRDERALLFLYFFPLSRTSS